MFDFQVSRVLSLIQVISGIDLTIGDSSVAGSSDSDMIVASLDNLVYIKLLRLKYPVFKMGKERHYMGSLTVQVGFDLSKIKVWEQHKYENRFISCRNCNMCTKYR